MTVLRSLSVAVAAALATFAVMVSPQPAIAAAIVWGTPQNIVGDTDVSTDGTLFTAVNFGPSSTGTAVTVNGVLFGAGGFTSNTITSATFGNIAVTTSTGTTNLENALLTTGSTPFSSLSASYRALLAPTLYQSSFVGLSFTISNLTVGSTYAIQYWVNDPRQPNGFNRSVLVGGTAVLDANVGDIPGGTGQWVVGQFVADATSQSFSASKAATSGGSFTYANAMQVRTVAVPEPTTIAMLIGAGVGLPVWRLRRSRRRTARAC